MILGRSTSSYGYTRFFVRLCSMVRTFHATSGVFVCLNRVGRLRLVRSCIFPFLDDSPVRPYPCSFLLECTHVSLLSRQQSLRNSHARLALFLCTLVMFLVSTVHLILHIVQYIVQVPHICDIDPLPSDVQEIWNATYAGLALLERLQYLISDAIVVWRAVVIWPRNWWVIGGYELLLVRHGW